MLCQYCLEPLPPCVDGEPQPVHYEHAEKCEARKAFLAQQGLMRWMNGKGVI